MNLTTKALPNKSLGMWAYLQKVEPTLDEI
jgi:hypothetical protein